MDNNQHNADFKLEQEQNPAADKKQKIDENLFKSLFGERAFGEEKYVVFYSDDGKSKQYSDAILNHIPVLKAAYDDGKESKIKLESKYIDILPWIFVFYTERPFTFMLNTIIKNVNVYSMDIYNILEFINKYMVTSQNTIEKLCISSENSWFCDLIREYLYVSQDTKYVKYVCNTIIEKYDEKFQTPYIKLLDDTFGIISKSYIDRLYEKTQDDVLKVRGHDDIVLTAINTKFNFDMLERIPDRYRTNFLTNILKEIDNITNVKKQCIKPAKNIDNLAFGFSSNSNVFSQHL